MSDRKLDYLNFKETVLDEVSDTFCAAKWYEVTMWLYMKSNASCHHNPTHSIELDDDPSSLHNTKQKIKERKQMLSGKRVGGCSYCWNAEDAGIISDRLMKSYGYNWDDLTKNIPMRVNPKKIEIAFSRSCQLACAYCSPTFSSSWANDLKANGSYNLKSNNRFNKDIKNKLIPDDTNEYIQEFFDWWPELQKDLQVLRFTGGEPLLHPKFWEFLEILDATRSYSGTFIVNSNLIHEKGQVANFIEKTKFLTEKEQKVEIHTSCESSLEHAEYTRDGFKAKIWYNNVIDILETSKIDITVTTAINNMSVWSFGEYLKMISNLKEKYGTERVRANFNRVLYPQWHSLAILPKKLRKQVANDLRLIYDDLPNLHDAVSNMGFQDLIKYLNDANFTDPIYTEEQVLRDAVSFYDQFNKRRNKDISVLDERYVNWIEKTRQDLNNE
jgi:organic radical activating enzyme